MADGKFYGEVLLTYYFSGLLNQLVHPFEIFDFRDLRT